jgi:UDP-2,4-diacetamido-2,4,6-trideoxy-beta-L-altropyranose hydrolase
VDWRRDAKETRVALGSAPDWLILDHYAFDARWEEAVCPAGTRLLVLDDLADRPHSCDLLLDQSLGREESEYTGLIPQKATCLFGAQYVLLRPEFSRFRQANLKRRTRRNAQEILIAMGGTDPLRIVPEILTVIAHLRSALGLRAVVMISSRAPHLDELRGHVARASFPCRLEIDSENVAALMTASDVAIAASGMIAYELACLGVPMLLLPVSNIQFKVAVELAASAEAHVVKSFANDRTENIRVALAGLVKRLRSESLRYIPISECLDGRGVNRLICAMKGVG